MRLAGGEHIVGGLHINACHAKWCRQCGFAGNQRDLRAGVRSGLRQCVTHFATGMIGDAAHRINRLEGRTGGNQDTFTRQALLGEQTWQQR